MIRKTLGVIMAVVVLFLIYIALQSPDFTISRSTKVNAPPEKVFAQVNDFHAWEAWSPWAKLDPNAKNTFAGPTAGKDAVFAWAGNDQVGEGRMTITESKPSELILIKLDFLKPFAATNRTEFTFKPEGEQTVVTWTMSGQNNFVGRMFCTLMNMQKQVGADFDKGLASMKQIAEASGK